ncbi:efflux transporter outer membrane subunit [Frateuria terrea]|uniref:Outer membrane protein, multidrug efflux system n=1 Tax=Frateuria terrea TaxID=529704 RepID=A0A1H6UCI0_9GAMM|nr:efflux transporter outer membrane subunit [Frateuria terrea]SEI87367.1 outer membrane protein, multidrug efflux system [Frateuria terrea]SFP38332.1 outer membrane protein, multidrug efflux system [Frateuria terrea]
MKPALLRLRTALAAATLLALAACAAPPARLAPPPLRNDVPLAGLQATSRAGWPGAQWWHAYDDPQLDELINRALRQAPDLALAQSRVQGAEQSARLAAAQMGLSINGNAQYARQRMSEHGLIPSRFLGFTWYNQADLGMQLKYDFDWWGKKRATVEAALDQAHAAEAQRSAAALALQYAVASTYFDWLADQARLALADRSLAAGEKLLRIAQLRVRQGVDLADTVEQAQAQVAGLKQLRTAIDGSAKVRQVVLASLLGVAPAELPQLDARPLPDVAPGLPENAGLDLIARRPDIAASRWQVEAALKQTDAARAQFFPDLSLTALAGLSSIDMGKLFTPGSRVFAVTPALHLPIFEGGALEANYGLSRAQLDSAVAQYRSTVLGAAREVSTQALSAEQLAAQRKEQQSELAADERLLANAQARLRQGVRDARESLAAELTLLQQRDAATQLHAQALATDLALIKALGGGYRSAPTPAVASSSPSPAGAAIHERH